MDVKEMSMGLRYLAGILLLMLIPQVCQAQTSPMAQSYLSRGNERFAKGDLDGAISDFAAALAFDPRLAPAYVSRGNARYAKKDLNGAIDDFNAAIQVNPRLANAYN